MYIKHTFNFLKKIKHELQVIDHLFNIVQHQKKYQVLQKSKPESVPFAVFYIDSQNNETLYALTPR